MSAGPDAPAGRRAARRLAPIGLCGGGVCLVVGGVLAFQAVQLTPIGYLEAEPAMGAEVRQPAAVKALLAAFFAVLGTMLASVGAVFALLERTGVLAAAAGPRPDGRAPVPHRDRPEPESRRGVATPTRDDPARVPTPAPDHRAGPTGAPPVRSGERASRPPMPAHPAAGTPGAPPVRSGEPAQARSAEPESDDATGPEPEVRPSEPRARVTETAAPPHAVEEPPPAEALQPGDLIAAWDDYRRAGDGHFSPRGLREVLDRRGFDAEVGHGKRVGAGGAVLIVETPSSTPRFYVLPSFNKSPRAVAHWFDDSGDGALTSRTQRLTRIAQGRWVEAGTEVVRDFEVIEKGEVA